jgi:glycyl-tRNA synthetase beta chain
LLERRGHAYDEISPSSPWTSGISRCVGPRARPSPKLAGRPISARSSSRSSASATSSGRAAGEPSPGLYREHAERRLAEEFLEARPVIDALGQGRRYREALERIAAIAPALDRFFVEVLVNCPEEDLRRNRLALLASIQKEFSRFADFSEIVVEKETK